MEMGKEKVAGRQRAAEMKTRGRSGGGDVKRGEKQIGKTREIKERCERKKEL